MASFPGIQKQTLLPLTSKMFTTLKNYSQRFSSNIVELIAIILLKLRKMFAPSSSQRLYEMYIQKSNDSVRLILWQFRTCLKVWEISFPFLRKLNIKALLCYMWPQEAPIEWCFPLTKRAVSLLNSLSSLDYLCSKIEKTNNTAGKMSMLISVENQ